MSGNAHAMPASIWAGQLELRRFRIDDAEMLAEVIEHNRDHLRPFMPFASRDPGDVEFRRQWIADSNAAFDRGTSFSYGIFDRDAIIGGCSIDPKSDKVASIGYWIAAKCTRRVRDRSGSSFTRRRVRCRNHNGLAPSR